LQAKGKHLITSAVEHHAGLQCFDYLEKKEGFAVTRLPVDGAGRVAVADLQRAFRPDTVLVSVMAANNEIGSVQPVAALGAACRARGIIFHTDAVQWFGKLPFTNLSQFNADLVSVCAHKFHGPKGAGLLYIRSPLHPDPILFGGGHENERRAGTENLPAIVGLVTALEKFIAPPVFFTDKIRELRERLALAIAMMDGCELVSPQAESLPNTVAFVVPGADGMALLAGLDMDGICASSGAACSAGSLEPSHVVLALGKKAAANSLVRFSLGRDSTAEEVEAVLAVLPEIIGRALRGKLPASGV